MPHVIADVEKDSVAEALDIRAGDILLSMNGNKVTDWIDYQSFSAESTISLITLRDGEEIEYIVEKDEYEPLGLKFKTQLMSRMRMCRNKCVFCFVDQLPENVRSSLRVKDDDWRLSLMMGNYVTLTNVTDKELDRIIARRASPLYISVHATDGPLRSMLLGVKGPDRLMYQLQKLTEDGLYFHAQAVLCPGINDGAVLDKTIADLAALAPRCVSFALVPVGLTSHRAGLFPLKPYDESGAREVLRIVEAAQAKYLHTLGTRFVFASDEFYLAANHEIPPEQDYEGYPQIENGVGMMRLTETEFSEAYEAGGGKSARPANIAIATGVSAAKFMDGMLRRYPIEGVDVSVTAIINNYFGRQVTVAGLITGGDLVRQMAGVRADKIFITECMLRADEDIFLDGMALSEAEAALGVPIVPVGRRGEDLYEALMRA